MMADQPLREDPIKSKSAVEMAQLAIDVPAQPPRGRDPRRPSCWACRDFGFETELLAAPGGKWLCGRGHGLID